MNPRSNAFYVLSAPGLKQQTYYILMHKIKNQSGEAAASANTFFPHPPPKKYKLFVI